MVAPGVAALITITSKIGFRRRNWGRGNIFLVRGSEPVIKETTITGITNILPKGVSWKKSPGGDSWVNALVERAKKKEKWVKRFATKS